MRNVCFVDSVIVKSSLCPRPAGVLAFFGQWFDGVADAAELARIGKYYAVEDMLTTDSSEKFGAVTLRQHYERIAREGQEYDPYTTLFGSKKN
ncbi:unnamed protein product [Sphagnum balticum]